MAPPQARQTAASLPTQGGEEEVVQGDGGAAEGDGLGPVGMAVDEVDGEDGGVQVGDVVEEAAAHRVAQDEAMEQHDPQV
jgi:hypothetical protein